MYPLLHGLEQDGYLQREDRVVGGKVRKYYTLTDAGREALNEAQGKIRELVDEVLEDHGPTHLEDLPSDAGPDEESSG